MANTEISVEARKPMHLLCAVRGDRTSCGFVGVNPADVTKNRNQVTCKRCLRGMAAEMRIGGLRR